MCLSCLSIVHLFWFLSVKSAYGCNRSNAVSIACPEHQKISVTFANFGRTEPDSVRCPYGNYHTDSTSCLSGSDYIIAQCQGLQDCAVNTSSLTRLVGDPCAGTFKYIEIHHICIGNSPGELFI